MRFLSILSLSLILALAVISATASAAPATAAAATKPVVVRQNNQLLQVLPAFVRDFLSGETDRINRHADPKIWGITDHNEQDPFFAPEAKNVFELKGYWLPAEKLKIYEASVPSELKKLLFRRVQGERQVLFLVHPESLSFYKKLLKSSRGEEIFNAVATASSRSLLLWRTDLSFQPFLAKVSLNKNVDHIVRTIKGAEVASSVGISDIIAHEADILPKEALFLPESLGVIPEGMPRGGMILRPLDILFQNPTSTFVPLFALYGVPKTGERELLLNQLMKTSLAPEAYVRENIIRPFVKIWFDLVVDHGIMMEPHAQNLLIELDPTGRPTGRFGLRDFGGFTIDFKFREKNGLYVPSPLPTFTGDRENDYNQYRTISNIRVSLENYFDAGFMYNVGEAIARWRKAGLLTDNGPHENLSTIILEEVDVAVRARSGGKITTGVDIAKIEGAILEMREKYRHRPTSRCSAFFH